MEELINAMVDKGHTRETAQGAIAGRGFDDLAREFLGRQTPSGGAATSPDISNVPSVQDFLSKQFATENQAFGELTTALQARENPLDIFTKLEAEAGLPTLRSTSQTLSKEIANIEDVLEQVEGDVSARTRESLVTEAQRRGIVSAKREPFLEKLTRLGTAAGRVGQQILGAERGVGQKTELAIAGQEQEIEPLKLRFTTLIDRNARSLSAFTEDRQTQLDQIFAKFDRDNFLSDREWEFANQLAQEEKSYLRNLQGAAADAGHAVSGNESANELLEILGTRAAEEIAFSRRDRGPSSTERSENERIAARRGALQDARGGAGLAEVSERYGDILGIDEIVTLYTSVSPHGTPKEEFARRILGLEDF